MTDLDRLDALRERVPSFYDDGEAMHETGDEGCLVDCRTCVYEAEVGIAYPELRAELVRLREENAALRVALEGTLHAIGNTWRLLDPDASRWEQHKAEAESGISRYDDPVAYRWKLAWLSYQAGLRALGGNQ